jgi:hypothetical protein
MARVLLDAGAMVDEISNVGWTPLGYAICSKSFNVVRLLLDRGAKVSNVKLDESVPSIPDWVTAFVDSRSNCRTASIIIIGIQKYHRTTVTGNNDINVLKLISVRISISEPRGVRALPSRDAPCWYHCGATWSKEKLERCPHPGLWFWEELLQK